MNTWVDAAVGRKACRQADRAPHFAQCLFLESSDLAERCDGKTTILVGLAWDERQQTLKDCWRPDPIKWAWRAVRDRNAAPVTLRSDEPYEPEQAPETAEEVEA